MEVYVHYEDHEVFCEVVPTRVMYRFDIGEIDWHAKTLLLPSYFDFVRSTTDDIIPDDMGSVLVMSTDLYRHPVHTDAFSVYLPAVIERIERQRAEYEMEFALYQIQQIIITVYDVEIVMQKRMSFLYESDDF